MTILALPTSSCGTPRDALHRLDCIRAVGYRIVLRSPALVALVADALAAGLPLATALELVGDIRDRLGGLADAVARTFVDAMWAPAAADGRAEEMLPLLRRERLLVVQAAASLLAHELGRALLESAVTTPHGDELRRAIDATRVGVVVDASHAAEEGVRS